MFSMLWIPVSIIGVVIFLSFVFVLYQVIVLDIEEELPELEDQNNKRRDIL